MNKMSHLFHGISSQSLRDITDDYYLELRKPKKVVFLVNGNINAPGKLLSITPNRYFILNELLEYLTKFYLKYIPNGVRKIMTKEGAQISDIDDLENQNFYVCCGMEPFKPLDYESKYYEIIYQGHLHNHNSRIKFFYTDEDSSPNLEYSKPPQTPFFYRGTRLYPILGNSTSPSSLKHSPRSTSQMVNEDLQEKPSTSNNERNKKPHIVTIIRNGEKPYTFFKMLLNKNSGQSYDDLLQDISEAFGSGSKRKYIKKLLSVSGNEVKEIPDLMKLGKYFVAIGDNERNLTGDEIQKIIENTFPNHDKISEENGENKSPQIKIVEDKESKNSNKPQGISSKERSGSSPRRNGSEKVNNYLPDKESNKLRKSPSMKSVKKNENVPKGYPYTDSRKPGAFDMPLDYQAADIDQTKMRARILGLERIRAGVEERERARDAKTKRLDHENDKFKGKIFNWGKYPIGFQDGNSDTKGDGIRHHYKNQSNKISDDKYKFSPYLNSLERPKYEWGNDKENWRPSKKQRDPFYTNHSKHHHPKNQNDIKPQSRIYPNWKNENDEKQTNQNNLKYPQTERIINWKPFKSQNSSTRRNEPASHRNSSKASNYDDFLSDNGRVHWERIPPISFGSRYNRNDRYRPQSDLKMLPLPTVNEEEVDGRLQRLNDDLNRKGNLTGKKKLIKHNISFEVDMEKDVKRNQEGKQISGLKEDPKKKINDTKTLIPEENSNDESNNSNKSTKTKLSLAGLRSETINVVKREKSHQRPSRTQKQSLSLQDPSRTRIVPLLASQLEDDDGINTLYNIGSILGIGNFAEVKKVVKKDTRKPYAAKIIDKSKLQDKEDLVEDEIKILKNCNHPNIVKLEEQYETPNKVYLIQEMVKEGDLFDAICENIKFPESQASVMVRDLLRALLYLHSRGIAHRDIKPENLLCTTRNGIINLKLTDFGLAVEVKEPLYVICGTPTYVAPEILTDQGYGIEVDIWAAGVICYILLCGFPPFRSPERNQTELFEFIKAGEFEFLKPYWNGISEESKDLISYMLMVNFEKRYTALDCLCHPWIVTLGKSIRFTKPLTEVINDTRIELEMEVERFKSQPKSIQNS